MALNLNPVLDELDNLSPAAKGALAQAHQNITGAAPAIAPVTQTPTPSVRPMPVPGASTVPPLGPPSTAPQAPATNPMAAAHTAELGRLTTGDTSKSGIAQIHNPVARIGLQIADAIGGGLFPGIEQRLPGTEGHHELLVRHAQRDVAGDEAAAANEAKNAELEQKGNEEAARAYDLMHPAPDKQENLGKTITNDQGIMQWNPATQRYDIPAGKAPEKPEAVHPPIADDQGNLWFQHADGTVTPVMANGKQLKGKQAEKTVAPEQQYIDEYRQLHPGSTVADAIHHYGIDSQRPQQAPQTLVLVPGADGNMKAQAVRPGQTVAPGAVTPAGMSSQNVPTSSTRTMMEAAPTVLSLADKVEDLVKQQENQLGPAKSRWSEFMAGKVGAPNPEFTKLRSDVKLLTTLLMRMHVGARGGEYIMKEFSDMMDQGRQSPENMLANVQVIKDYARDVAAGRTPRIQQEALNRESSGENSDSSDMITVQIPGQPAGKIHVSQKAAFLKKFPNAKVE